MIYRMNQMTGQLEFVSQILFILLILSIIRENATAKAALTHGRTSDTRSNQTN
jgi:hypothetical protein